MASSFSGKPAPRPASSPVSPENAASEFLKKLRTPCRLLVAYSGGGDSTGLMVALAEALKADPGLDVSLVAATVDHGLRPESAAEARAVGTLCAKLSIPHHILTWQGEKPKTGIQAAAREARYRLLGQLADTVKADLIVTAHNHDDQIETLAMRKARNPAAEGGISEAVLYDRHIWICRPFLDVRRTDIRAYLTARGIGWVDDPSNDNEAFERVRVRKALAGSPSTLEVNDESTLVKTPSGLPAISPTRGEKTRGYASPNRGIGGGVGLSPSPLWGGVGEGTLCADEGLDNGDEATARFLLANAVIHSARVAVLDLRGYSSANPEYLQAVRHLVALMGGRTHLAGGETTNRIAGFLVSSGEHRLTAERVVLDRRKHLLYITRERRSLPTVTIAPGATAIWDNRFRLSNHGAESIVVGVRSDARCGQAVVAGDLPGHLPGAVVQCIGATEPRLLDGRLAGLRVEPIITQFDRFLPLRMLGVANALAFLTGLDHFPGLPTR